jgi:hypothetical protein
MDLAGAQSIARRPEGRRPRVLDRALSILMRWAQEPCVKKEYEKRLSACRKVYAQILVWKAKLEKALEKKWRFNKRLHAKTGLDALAGSLPLFKSTKTVRVVLRRSTTRTSSKEKKLASRRLPLAKKRGASSATSLI